MLTYETLEGICVAVPIALNEDLSFNESAYRSDINTLSASGVQGIYTTGTTGEFHALEDDEFEWMVDVFTEETSKHSVYTQIGTTAFEVARTLRRTRYAAKAGAHGLQIALPFWSPVNDAEMIDFYKAVADAAEGVPLILYNTMRSKRFLSPATIERLLKEVPTIIGTKHGTNSFTDFLEAGQSGLPVQFFLTSEAGLASLWHYGVRGVYSADALMNPAPCVRLYELCKAGKWEEAFALQDLFAKFVVHAQQKLADRGLTDPAWDKGKAVAGRILKCPRYTRPPFRPMTAEDAEFLRERTLEVFPELVNGGTG
jgi:dihydrodipicolinate synthase/N-acetylneuraminate lyase